MQHVKTKCLSRTTKCQIYWNLVVEYLTRFSNLGNGGDLLHSACILQVKKTTPEENSFLKISQMDSFGIGTQVLIA